MGSPVEPGAIRRHSLGHGVFRIWNEGYDLIRPVRPMHAPDILLFSKSIQTIADTHASRSGFRITVSAAGVERRRDLVGAQCSEDEALKVQERTIIA
jgi:hypothetical protein